MNLAEKKKNIYAKLAVGGRSSTVPPTRLKFEVASAENPQIKGFVRLCVANVKSNVLRFLLLKIGRNC